MSEQQAQPGPCVVCGARNYPLSMGGPSICPACDCGIPPGPRLNEELERVEAERDALAARVAGCPDEGQREDARVSVGLARIGPHGPRTTGKVQTVEDAEIDAINAGYEVWIDRHELPDDFDAYLHVARAVIASLAASPALGAVAASPDQEDQ